MENCKGQGMTPAPCPYYFPQGSAEGYGVTFSSPFISGW